jgi:SET domain-containing protein
VPKRLILPKRNPPWRSRFRVGRSRTGLGLFALKPIKRGEFISYYFGPLITNKRADELWTKYLFEVNNRWTIDGSGRNNVARYINHSCRPNAESDVKKHKVFIAAIKTINPGDEITYNYGKDYFDTFIKPHGCLCLGCKKKAAEKRAEARLKAARRAKRLAKAKKLARAKSRKKAARAASRKQRARA